MREIYRYILQTNEPFIHYIFRLQVYLKTMNAMRAKCIKYESTGEMYTQRNNEYDKHNVKLNIVRRYVLSARYTARYLKNKHDGKWCADGK